MSNSVHYLKDYRAPAYLVPAIELTFDIFDEYTDVAACLQIEPQAGGGSLKLAGGAKLLSLSLNGQTLSSEDYALQDEELTVFSVPEKPFALTVHTRIRPQDNHSLNGLYASGGNLYTQCEPEGFRKITFHPDRPDVMGVYTVTIRADKARFPVLLSNGNLTDSGDLPDGRHFARWHDPFAKPSYLFALVAGDLAVTRDHFITRSGKDVALELYTRAEDADKVGFALASLKHAMAWDETRFGLEYDLDVYMIVAVSDFNMGAMENKGLNIFNTKYVLADSHTATDADFEGVEAVIAHEYFHNWTGNRVTCRDWFQLSLKEGLTVFRDQEFSADRAGREVRRIENVSALRAHQFPEDAGPTAHPVRPASYVEMNNFYTMTVYEKGAEVVRMYHTFLGEEGFQRGMKRYFDRHDGQAVTCDDFLAAMADANGIDFQPFALWYSQAGTPTLDISGSLKENGDYVLHIKQTLPDTPDMPAGNKQPMMMPLAVALFNEQGEKAAFRLPDNESSLNEAVLTVCQAEQDFVLRHVHQAVTPSLLRQFSAPVHLNFCYTDEQLALLLAHDDDAFARWEAGQTLYRRAIAANEAALAENRPLPEARVLFDAFGRVLQADIAPDFKALLMQPPTESEWWTGRNHIDPLRVHHAREALLDALAQRFADDITRLHDQAREQEEHSGLADPYAYHPEPAAWRSLRNVCRTLMQRAQPEQHIAQLSATYDAQAKNMTHHWGMLTAVNHNEADERNHLLARFAEQFADQELVMDKYFMLIAASRRHDTPAQVRAALQHPAFKLTNPNKVRALLGTFARNVPHFHAENGSGYTFIAEHVRTIDAFNPQSAAALARTAFSLCHSLEPQRRALMTQQLQQLATLPELSKDVREIVEKILHGQPES